MTFDQYLEKFRSELESNHRLRMLLSLVAGILCFYLLLVLHDYRVGIELDAEAMANRYSKMQGASGQTDWQKLAQDAAALEATILESFWHAPSESVIKASFQSAVEDVFLNNGVKTASVVAESYTEDRAGLNLVGVVLTVRGEFNGHSFYSVLRDIEYGSKLAVVQSLDMTDNRGRTQYRVVFSTWGLVEQEGEN